MEDRSVGVDARDGIVSVPVVNESLRGGQAFLDCLSPCRVATFDTYVAHDIETIFGVGATNTTEYLKVNNLDEILDYIGNRTPTDAEMAEWYRCRVDFYYGSEGSQTGSHDSQTLQTHPNPKHHYISVLHLLKTGSWVLSGQL